MKILVDMNMSPKWAAALAAAGISAVHWSEIGHAAEEDTKIMNHAATQGLCVLTRDMDFSAILAATGNTTPSVILHRNGQRFSEALAKELIAALRQTEAELERGAIVSIARGRVRIRPLPLE